MGDREVTDGYDARVKGSYALLNGRRRRDQRRKPMAGKIFHAFHAPGYQPPKPLGEIVFVHNGLGDVFMDVINDPLAPCSQKQSHPQQLWIMKVVDVSGLTHCFPVGDPSYAYQSIETVLGLRKSPDPHALDYLVAVVGCDQQHFIVLLR